MSINFRLMLAFGVSLGVLCLHKLESAVWAGELKSQTAAKIKPGQSKRSKLPIKGTLPAESTSVTNKTALSLVEALPEVKRWRADIKKLGAKRGVKAVVEVDRQEGAEIVVHVYEIVPDDNESSHTATLNWYYVDKKTAKIRKEF